MLVRMSVAGLWRGRLSRADGLLGRQSRILWIEERKMKTEGGKEKSMEKARRPHVIRTWTVERTRLPYHPPQQAHVKPDPSRQKGHGALQPPHGPPPQPHNKG